MKKMCPNLDREDVLDTVLEVPIPEEMFASGGSSRNHRTLCSNMLRAWMRSHVDHRLALAPSSVGRGAELQLMLGVIGAPLVPLPIEQDHQSIATRDFKEDPIEFSMAKYIVQQYVAAAGGGTALNSINSLYAMGKVWMTASDLRPGNGTGVAGGGNAHRRLTRGGGGFGVGGDMGGFVLWQKRPDLWSLELVVSGYKVSAGSDGKVAWRQTPWQQSHASRGPPRLLRRFLQEKGCPHWRKPDGRKWPNVKPCAIAEKSHAWEGLDPRSTANLFSNAVCIGERGINGEGCFVLRVDAEAATLRARSSSNVEIIRHTVWGYFSQRTGLLAQLEDSHLLRIKGSDGSSVYWETTMESLIEDYRPVDGVYIAHAGRTKVSLFRFGETREGQTRTRMEETWQVEEVDFNIWGLSKDCFLPPRDLKEERGGCHVAVKTTARPPPAMVVRAASRIGPSQVAAVDEDDSDSIHDDDEDEEIP